MFSDQSIVAKWNEVMLESIRSTGAKPTETTYQLYLTSAAIYEAWAAYDSLADGQYGLLDRPVAEQDDAHKAEAISYAAYSMLSHFFPHRQDHLDAFMDDLGYDTAITGTDPDTAAGLGNLAAQTVLEMRAGDGSNSENGYADTTGYVPVNSADPDAPNAPGGPDFDPNSWQPLRVPTGTVVDENGAPIIDPDDPTSYADQIALTPHWGGVTPFALSSGDQFRPDAPPELGNFDVYVDGTGKITTFDQAWRDQFTEVLHTSANLTTEQKVIAEYWADGPRTESPPGHWNQIAQDIALREGHGIDEDAKLFFALNATLFDAGIATWEAKFHYNMIRPQSAIRHLYDGQEVQAWGGPNQGTHTIMAEEWQPYQNLTFVTPPFPEFVSGHSAFSMSAARTIASFVGSDQFYDGSNHSNYDLDNVAGTDLLGEYVATRLAFEDWTEGEPPVVLHWDTLTEAAVEAGISRIYGGIHIQDGNLRSLELGKQVAAETEIRWNALFTRGGEDTLYCLQKGGLVIAGGGDDLVFGRGGQDMIEGGSGDDILRGRRGLDRIDGGDGDDEVYGGRDADVLLGGTGSDMLNGQEGRDLLMGQDGADRLCGKDGDDFLQGGKGRDFLVGGAGSDSFIFDLSDADEHFDTIRDFNAEEDHILLTGYEADAEVTVIQLGKHAVIFVENDCIAMLQRTDADALVIDATILFGDMPMP